MTVDHSRISITLTKETRSTSPDGETQTIMHYNIQVIRCKCNMVEKLIAFEVIVLHRKDSEHELLAPSDQGERPRNQPLNQTGLRS